MLLHRTYRRSNGKRHAGGEHRTIVKGVPKRSFQEMRLARVDLADHTFQYRVVPRPDLLAKSIAAMGIHVPIIARPHPARPGQHQIICGFQRAMAASMVGLTTVPVMVMDLDDEQASTLAFTENEERRTLSDIDRAQAIVKLKSTGRTTEEVASLLHLSRRHVENIRALLDYPPELRAAIDDLTSGVTATHAIVLMEGKRRYGTAFNIEDWILRVGEKRWSVVRLRRSIREQFQADPSRSSLVHRTTAKFTIDLKAIPKASDSVRTAAIADLERIIEELR